MDKTDLEILHSISSTGSGRPEVIHDDTGIPKSTVHYRMESLRERGILSGKLNEIDEREAGLDITVVTEVTATYDEGYHSDVGDRLAEIEGVNKVFFTMGETDFVVVSRLLDDGHVEGLIGEFEATDGVQRTSSRFVVKTIKDEPYSLDSYDVDTVTGAEDRTVQ